MRPLVILSLFVTTAWAQDRPDIIIIMADDMGWSDIRTWTPWRRTGCG